MNWKELVEEHLTYLKMPKISKELLENDWNDYYKFKSFFKKGKDSFGYDMQSKYKFSKELITMNDHKAYDFIKKHYVVDVNQELKKENKMRD